MTKSVKAAKAQGRQLTLFGKIGPELYNRLESKGVARSITKV